MADAAPPNPSHTDDPEDQAGPSYDEDRPGYAGISSGLPDSVDDVHDARAFAEMIVDTVREGLLVLDFDLRVVAANESFYQTFGVDPEETLGRSVYDLVGGQWDIPGLRELLEDVLPENHTFNGFTVEHEFDGLGVRHMVLNGRRLNDHQRVLLAIEDATDRRQAEGRARKLSRSLLVAEQGERRRLALVLHEDLQQVLYGAQIAVAQGHTDRAEAALERAGQIARQLSHDLAPPLLRDGDLGDLVRWLAGRAPEAFGVEVEAVVGDDVAVPAEEVRVLLYGLLRELLLNVAKHAGTGRARVVAERAGDDGDGRVRVRVEDEGPGFDPGALDGQAGGGLGLPSVRERIELVGGRFEVESAPGGGTRVTLVVPPSEEE